MENALLWQLLKYSAYLDQMLSSYFKIKGRDRRTWPDYPWSKPDDGGRSNTYGHVAEEDRRLAAEYLLTL